ncbi:MAG: hypothetical protein LBU61_03815, partial [Coriobacteriales bacterium]|nr:hypothetical protein [Coriobacteriales bacterium]
MMMKSKAMPIALVLVMLLTLVPAFILPAQAADGEVPVADETELRTAVSSAAGPTEIVFTDDIELTGTPLVIPAGAEITLSSDDDGPYSLFGVDGFDTISVATGGNLVLD